MERNSEDVFQEAAFYPLTDGRGVKESINWAYMCFVDV